MALLFVMPLIAPSVVRANAVSIGSHRNLLVNGEPFYPICVYHANASKAAAMGFNCVLADSNYPSQALTLDLQAGFSASFLNHVLNSLDFSDYVRSGSAAGIANVAQSAANLPFLFNYVVDEPQYYPKATAQLVQSATQTIRKFDPNHLTLIVGDRDGNVRNGINASAGSDVIGVDIYPVRWRDARYGYPPTNNLETAIGPVLDANVKSVGGNVPTMFVEQAHSLPSDSAYPESGRYPTPEELKAMAYLALNHGAKGIFFYAMDDNYGGYKGFAFDQTVSGYLPALIDELKATLPIYVNGEVVPLITGSGLSEVAIRFGCRIAFVAVNPTAQSVSADAPGIGWRAFSPLEVVMQTLDNPDCGSPQEPVGKEDLR